MNPSLEAAECPFGERGSDNLMLARQPSQNREGKGEHHTLTANNQEKMCPPCDPVVCSWQELRPAGGRPARPDRTGQLVRDACISFTSLTHDLHDAILVSRYAHARRQHQEQLATPSPSYLPLDRASRFFQFLVI